MQIDILIDKLTNCLIERSTGAVIDTEYIAKQDVIKKKEYVGWKFNWIMTEEKGYTIYELFVKGNPIVQGRISLKIDGGVADVDIVETAPHNFGKNGKYIGVGGHLFAIACQVSMENDCDGFVTFVAKTDLIGYYEKILGAKVAFGQRMYIDKEVAQILIDKYIRK